MLDEKYCAYRATGIPESAKYSPHAALGIMGVHASRNLEPSTLLSSTKALLKLPLKGHVMPNLDAVYSAFLDCNLSREKEYMSLKINHRGREYLSRHQSAPEDTHKKHTVMAIFLSHAFNTGDCYIVFPEHKFRNSCRPNAIASIDEKEQLTVWSLGKIQKGQEIFVSYLDKIELLLANSIRHQKLEDDYGVKCHCSATLDERSDGRRKAVFTYYSNYLELRDESAHAKTRYTAFQAIRKTCSKAAEEAKAEGLLQYASEIYMYAAAALLDFQTCGEDRSKAIQDLGDVVSANSSTVNTQALKLLQLAFNDSVLVHGKEHVQTKNIKLMMKTSGRKRVLSWLKAMPPR